MVRKQAAGYPVGAGSHPGAVREGRVGNAWSPGCLANQVAARGELNRNGLSLSGSTTARYRFIPFLQFVPAVRKVICTTNTNESLNYQIRTIIRNRGQCLNDSAVDKLLWLSIRNFEGKRTRQSAKAASRAEASQHGNPIEGTTTQGWNESLGALVFAFPERFEGHFN